MQESHHLRSQWNFTTLLLHSSVLMQVIESILRQKPAPIQNHNGVDEQQSGLFCVMVVVVESKSEVQWDGNGTNLTLAKTEIYTQTLNMFHSESPILC